MPHMPTTLALQESHRVLPRTSAGTTGRAEARETGSKGRFKLRWLLVPAAFILLATGPARASRLWHQVLAWRNPVHTSPHRDAAWYNRFASWPWREDLNAGCPLPPQVQKALGWDVRGLSYAVLDARHVLLSHHPLPAATTLSFWDGHQVLQRQVERSLTVRLWPEAPAVLHVARLDEALPASIAPLPVFPHFAERLPAYFKDHTVIPFARGGKFGAQRLVGITSPISSEGLVTLAARPAPDHPGGIGLNYGDSGGALLLEDQGDWYLVGSTFSFVSPPSAEGPPEASQAAFNTFYYLPSYVEVLRQQGITLPFTP